MSVIGTGLAYRQQAEQLATQADQLSLERKQQNEMIKQADTQQKLGLAGMGAALGMAGGPVGMAVGAGIGYLVGEFL
jgi:phage tail tape-measure protein